MNPSKNNYENQLALIQSDNVNVSRTSDIKSFFILIAGIADRIGITRTADQSARRRISDRREALQIEAARLRINSPPMVVKNICRISITPQF